MGFINGKFNWCVFILVIQIKNIVGEEHPITTEPDKIQISIPSGENNVSNTDSNNTVLTYEVPIPIKTADNETAEVLSNVTKVNCLTDKEYGPVKIINATGLVHLLQSGSSIKGKSSKEGKLLPGTCILVMFYASWCIFSSQAAPHFNALPRFFPYIQIVAIDAMKYPNFNTQYGIVGVPTLMLLHNGKPVAKFNDTVYTLETFSIFITQLTTLEPNGSLYVTSADFSGPVSSTPSNETDYCLVLSWIFIAACIIYFTLQSQWWQQFVELVQNTWRESNAQHEHVD